MYSNFDVNHWKRVKQARAELGLNRIPAAATLRPTHRLSQATLRHLATDQLWTVTAVREDWLMGRYLEATLERNGQIRSCVVETISSEHPEIIQQLGTFNTEFDALTH